ncbi:MAG: hypothetical protein PW843_24480 [Azospirillaceae bacterium]|nr:hypothetical protein [Azospirillaceae bacterium]
MNAARDEGAHNRIGFSKDDWGVDQTRSTAAKGQLQTAMANQGPDQNQVEEFQKDQFGPQQLQRQLQAQAAIWTEGRAALLAKEVEAWQQLIQTGNLGAEALTEAQRQLNTAQAALRQQNSADAVANARDGLASQAAVTDQGRAQRLQAQIAADRELLASTTLTVEDRKGVQRDLNAALAQLRQQDSADAIAQSRAQLAEQAAVGSQTRAQQLQAQISADEQLLASGKLTADARLGVERELNLAKASLAHEQAAEGLRTLQEEVTVARAGSQERIALLQQELAYAKAHFGAMSTEAKDAQTALTAAVREGQKEREGIEREANNTSIQLSKIATEAERDRLEAEVQAGRITEAQKIASLKRLADAEYEQNLEMLIEQRAALTEGTLAWQQAQDKIDVLTATHTAQLAKYADQTATANAKAAQASARAWESALAPVERAWDSSLTGWIQGTQTLQQAMAKMGTAILAEEITTDTKWLSHKLLVNAMGLASDKSTAQGGLLAYLLADRSKTVSATAAEATRTASTATGVATRTATTATESSSFIGRLGSMIAGWLGLETGKTAATAAGVTDRAIADKAEAIAETTKAEGEIQIAAAVAGANAYAAYAAVPPVAAAMAAEAVGAVQAFNSMLAVGGGLASAAGGWGQVPYDGAITELHKNEMVLPASIASPLRAAVTTWRNPPANLVANQNGAAAAAPAATGGQAGGDVHLHVNAMDTKSVAQFFQANKGPLADALKAAHRNGKR